MSDKRDGGTTETAVGALQSGDPALLSYQGAITKPLQASFPSSIKLEITFYISEDWFNELAAA